MALRLAPGIIAAVGCVVLGWMLGARPSSFSPAKPDRSADDAGKRSVVAQLDANKGEGKRTEPGPGNNGSDQAERRSMGLLPAPLEALVDEAARIGSASFEFDPSGNLILHGVAVDTKAVDALVAELIGHNLSFDVALRSAAGVPAFCALMRTLQGYGVSPDFSVAGPGDAVETVLSDGVVLIVIRSEDGATYGIDREWNYYEESDF